MIKKIKTEALETKRIRLMALLNSGKPLIASTLSEVHTRCGNPNCRCASGEKHVAHLLTRRENGKTKTIYVPVELVEDVRKWTEEYHRLKELMNDITLIGEEIVRRHVKGKRKQKTK